MGQYVQTGKTAITGAVTANVEIADNVAIKSVTGSQDSYATFTIGTVPANKKWTIVGVFVTASIYVSGAGYAKTAVLLNGAEFLNICWTRNAAATYIGGGTNNSVIFPVGFRPVLTAAQTVTCTQVGDSNTNSKHGGGVWYVEESV